MRQPLCHFVSAFNQALEKKRPSFSFAYFRQFVPLMRVLVSEGYVQYYTLEGPRVRVYLRMSQEGPLLSKVRLGSTPGRKKYMGWKESKKGVFCQLALFGSDVQSNLTMPHLRQGGILLLEVA